MGVTSHKELERAALPLSLYRKQLGFVPNVVSAQSRLPRLIQVDRLLCGVIGQQGALTAIQKELIQLVVAVGNECVYETALRLHFLGKLGLAGRQLDQVVFDYRQANLSKGDEALVHFALRLAGHPTWINPEDIDELRRCGLGDQHVVEATLVVSWSNYRCVMASALNVEPDFECIAIPSGAERRTRFRPPTSRAGNSDNTKRPYVVGPKLPADSFAPFADFEQRYGFIPNVYLSQTARPDVIEAELHAGSLVLDTDDVLTRSRKEYIFLAVSAANLNTYCVAIHCEVLRAMGASDRELEQIAIDHHLADLCEADKALLDYCLKLARRRTAISPEDRQALLTHGFSDIEMIEAAAVTAMAFFFNTLDTGVAAEPDFQDNIPWDYDAAHLLLLPEHPTARQPESEDGSLDPDAEYVARAQQGDADSFEELVRRHGRRVERTLGGILRNREEVEDAVQETFLKAYQNIQRFEGRSRFSTWLTRIAFNAGLQRLRGGKVLQSLDEQPDTLDRFRPRNLQPWQDNPEQSYTRTRMRELVLEGLAKLPAKYRIAIVLRDLQQLSTAEAADVMGIKVPALKARLHRGRLMLREALAPHFGREET